MNAIHDQTQRQATETMIKTYGQTPRQLFKSPHPHRNTPKPSGDYIALVCSYRLVRPLTNNTKTYVIIL